MHNKLGGSMGLVMRPFAERQRDDVRSALKAKGFVEIDPVEVNSRIGTARIAEKYAGPLDSRIILPCEDVYRKNNFTIFAKTDPEEDCVTTFYNDPLFDGKNKEHPYQYVKKKYWYGNTENNAVRIAEKAELHAGGMAQNGESVRALIHIHTGYMPNWDDAFFDDGVSNVKDIVRWALVHHKKIMALTPHNDFNLERYRQLKEACEQAGIVLVLAIELTATIMDGHLNGPHLLLLVDSEETANEICRRILVHREHTEMPSYAQYAKGTGVNIEHIFKVLNSGELRGKVAFGPAHPFNGWPSNVIGLMSAVIEGQLDWGTAQDFLKLCHFAEGWNVALEDKELEVRDTTLRNKLREMISLNIPEIVGKPRLTPNVLNYALAKSLAETGGKGVSAGTDDHATPPFPLDYPKGGTRMGVIETFLKIPEGVALTAENLVHGLAYGTIKMSSKIFAESANGIIKIPESLLNVPREIRGFTHGLKAKEFFNYVHVIAKDMLADPGRIWHARD